MSVATFSDQEVFFLLEEEWLWLEDGDVQKARNNNSKIFCKIGKVYYDKRYYSKALAWYRKAEALNDSDAQYMIGFMYLRGNGIPQDKSLAMGWYLQAANNDGNKEAQFEIAEMYRMGHSVPKNIHTTIEWCIKAANQGYSIAQWKLGWIFEYEDEVKDLQKAVNWYRKAADNGHENAKTVLKRLNEKGYYPVEEDNAIEEKADKEQQITDKVNSNNSREEIKDEAPNNNNKQKQSTSTSQNLECDMELLKNKVKELEEDFQLKFSLIEQEKKDTEKRNKAMEAQQKEGKNKATEDEKQKIEIQQKEEIKQLKEALSESRAALEEKEKKMKEMEVQQKEKNEEIRILKAALAHFKADAKDMPNKINYY